MNFIIRELVYICMYMEKARNHCNSGISGMRSVP